MRHEHTRFICGYGPFAVIDARRQTIAAALEYRGVETTTSFLQLLMGMNKNGKRGRREFRMPRDERDGRNGPYNDKYKLAQFLRTSRSFRI